MNVVFLERSTRTSSAGSRFLVITLIEIQGIQIVSQPKHFSAQPIHLRTNAFLHEYGFGHRQENRRLVGHFYDMENQFWAVGCGLGWAVGKKVWADYEQLLREVFSI